MNLEEIKDLEREEFELRHKTLSFIASENYCSENVLEANGSVFMQVYSEGFPQKRYYEGSEIVDKVEQECINACLELFNAKDEYYANVQPNSGNSANFIAYNAILEPDDFVLAPDVASLGHISHSHPKSFISKYHQVYTYGVDENGLLNYDEIERIALNVRPKLIIAGASNYPREIDFKRFAQICDKVKQKNNYLASSLGYSIDNNCYLMADMAHTNIFHAHGLLMSPVGYADIITSSSHKALGSTRSGFIIYKKDLHKAMCTSTIPTSFGGPLNHLTYAKLIGFKEAMTEESKKYSKQVFKNAKIMVETFKKNGIPVITGDTENHLCTIDLTDFNINGKELSQMLHEKCNLTTNANTIPTDTSFLRPNGVRFGTCAVTKRGLKESQVKRLIQCICDIILLYKNSVVDKDELTKKLDNLYYSVYEYTQNYPLKDIYPNRYKYLFEENI